MTRFHTPSILSDGKKGKKIVRTNTEIFPYVCAPTFETLFLKWVGSEKYAAVVHKLINLTL